jgi:hypothetical protein
MSMDGNMRTNAKCQEIINAAVRGEPFDMRIPIFTKDDLLNNPQLAKVEVSEKRVTNER